MNAHTPIIPQFDWRTVRCPNEGCDDGWQTDESGWSITRCEECGGRAVVDASCADCLCVKPLDAEGFCADCAEPLVDVEHIAPGRIAA